MKSLYPVLKLGELVKAKGGKRLPSGKTYSQHKTDHAYLRVCDFRKGTINDDDLRYIDNDIHNKISRYTIDEKDVFLSIAGTIGIAGVVPKRLSGSNLTENAAKLVIKDKSKLNKNYLAWFLNTCGQVEIANQTKATSQPKLALFRIEELTIPLPPLQEQIRIAAILDKADTIRSKRQQAIKLADDFLRATFLDMFGDPVTNHKDWEIKAFSEIGELNRGKSKHRPRNAPELLGGPYPLIQTGDVANSNGYIKEYKSTYSELGLKQSKIWTSGTLCITIAANIAKTGILTFEACFPDSVVGFTPNNLTTTEYVQAWLGFLQKTLEAKAPESAQKNINLEILRNLEIPIPPLSQQNNFSLIVNQVNNVLTKINTNIECSDKLFNALSQKAFKGEI